MNPVGKCVPVTNALCQANGFNHTAFPNMLGGVAIDRPANQVVQMMDGNVLTKMTLKY